MHNAVVMDAIQLSLFASRIAAACDEMGAVLRRAIWGSSSSSQRARKSLLQQPHGLGFFLEPRPVVGVGDVDQALRFLAHRGIA